ncbi:MAG: uroporphyrinogen decarboxylase family protein [Bryobacteraceae bacterium]
MNRRTFLAASSLGAMPLWAKAAPVNKRERMLSWLAGKADPNYTPAAFFLHFAPEFKNGSAAAQKHLEFFRHTGMDFVKVQFEQTYERQAFLEKPADWSKLTLRKIDFYEPLLVTVRDLVKSTKKDALILMTLYSPFMCAGHCATGPVLLRHLEENPEAVKRGLDILTESQMIFVRACIKAGIDGFYMSTQGSEAKRFSTPKIFAQYVKPYDLVAMKEAQDSCPFNILHVCDYVAPYADYDVVREYPGHVVNCNTQLTGKEIAPREIGSFFGRPYMGGMDRHGILGKGSPPQVEDEIRRVVKSAPKQFILGADCTVAGDTDWNRLRDAIAVAHRTGSGRA